MKTIGSVLRRLLLALGGSAAENYLNDITLVDRIAELAENGQISSSVIQGGVDLLSVYPVGSIYMSVNSTNPSTLFGGTWQQIENRFLLGAGSDYTAGDTGGEATHQLVANELPKVNGSFNIRRWATGGAGTAAFDFSGVFSDSTVTGSANPIADGSNAGNLQKISMAFGNDQAHNNMPPYLAVYIWKRTA